MYDYTGSLIAPRDDDPAYERATWCSNYNVPCRLVQYSHDVIADACGKYLAYEEEVVTVTEKVPGPRVTEVVDAKECGYEAQKPEHEYQEDEQVYDHASDHQGEENTHTDEYEHHEDEHEHEEIPPHFDFDDGGNSFDFGSDDGTDTPDFEYEEDGVN